MSYADDITSNDEPSRVCEGCGKRTPMGVQCNCGASRALREIAELRARVDSGDSAIRAVSAQVNERIDALLKVTEYRVECKNRSDASRANGEPVDGNAIPGTKYTWDFDSLRASVTEWRMRAERAEAERDRAITAALFFRRWMRRLLGGGGEFAKARAKEVDECHAWLDEVLP